MNSVTNEQLAKMLNDYIAQHDEDVQDIKEELKEIRTENQEFRDILIGAKFLATFGKALLIVGGIIGMLYAAFMVLKGTTIK